ncbi:MAG TPA: DUF2993 domain-containing protein [Microbacterium sp.]|nr:DUF2993 domain-containing protein [Microbacterium sp.]
MTAATPGADARQRRARWPRVVVIVVVVLAVLLVAAELTARAVLPGVVRSIVVEQLDLPSDQELDVQASGVLIPQLLTGTLDELRLSSDDVTIGGITGAAHVTATGVPLRGGALGSAKGTVSVDQTQFAVLLEDSQLPDAEISLAAPNATLQGEITLLGRAIPVGLTVTPGAEGGDLLLTPVSVTLGGNELDLQALGGLFGDVGESLAGPQRLCIADQLPAGITLTGLRVQGTRAVADITADGRIAVDPALLENGTCPR